MTEMQFGSVKRKLLALYNNGYPWIELSRLEKKKCIDLWKRDLGFALTKKEVNQIYKCIMLGISYNNIEKTEKNIYDDCR